MWGGSREAVLVNPSYHGLDRQTVGMCSILPPSLNCHGHRRGLLEKEQERMYLRCCSRDGAGETVSWCTTPSRLLCTHHHCLSRWEALYSKPSVLLKAQVPSTISSIHTAWGCLLILPLPMQRVSVLGSVYVGVLVPCPIMGSHESM